MKNMQFRGVLRLLCATGMSAIIAFGATGCSSIQGGTNHTTEVSTTEDGTNDETTGTGETEETVESQTAATTAAAEPIDFDYDAEYSLKDIYKDDFLMGTIYNNFTTSDEVVTQQFNVLTAENCMKPESIEPREGQFNFNNAQRFLDFATSNDIAVHAHVLVWHQQSADWMGKNVSREVAIEQMKTYIFTAIENMDDGVISWDVINEAIDDGAKLPSDGDWTRCLRDSQWKRAIGEDYFVMAFQFAAEAIEKVNPDIKLYYNDYNLDNYEKAKIVVAMVKDLQSQGIRIDGVGMQGHYNTGTSVSSVENSISMFRELGIEVSITELDVADYDVTNGVMTEEQEIRQAQLYARLMQIYKANSDIIGRVTIWGHRDNESWRSTNAPVLYDRNGDPKEAFYAMADPDNYLLAHPITDVQETREANALYGTPTIDGEEDDIWSDAISYQLNKQLTAWEGATGSVKLMWDENYLYVLMHVNDSVLNADSKNLYEQDSIEVYLDQMNDKTSFYGYDDGQYRVNYKNEVSFGDSTPDTDLKFESATKEVSGGYIVEVAIPVVVTPYADRVMGFDCQINDATAAGSRQSIVKFCDMTDNSFTTTENWGIVTLTK